VRPGYDLLIVSLIEGSKQGYDGIVEIAVAEEWGKEE